MVPSKIYSYKKGLY